MSYDGPPPTYEEARKDMDGKGGGQEKREERKDGKKKQEEKKGGKDRYKWTWFCHKCGKLVDSVTREACPRCSHKRCYECPLERVKVKAK